MNILPRNMAYIQKKVNIDGEGIEQELLRYKGNAFQVFNHLRWNKTSELTC